MNKIFQTTALLFAGAVAVMTLTGCDKTKEMFGMKREQPDEFTVLSRPPLSAPPGIGLKPPLPEGAGPQEQAPREEAKAALLGDQPSTTVTPPSQEMSATEKALLESTGAQDTDPQIRRTLAETADQEQAEKEGPLQDMLYWQKKEAAGDVIDPHAEHEKHHTEPHPSKSH